MGRDLPRVCGDQPGYTFVLDYWCEFPPRARGSTLVIALSAKIVYIYPACAGINPMDMPLATSKKNLPRTCGDQPAIENCCAFQRKFTRIRGDQPRVTVMVAPFSAFTPHVRGLSYISYRYIHYWQTSPIVRGFSPGGIHDDVAIYISYYICCSLSSLTSPNVILVGMIPNSDLALATLS